MSTSIATPTRRDIASVGTPDRKKKSPRSSPPSSSRRKQTRGSLSLGNRSHARLSDKAVRTIFICLYKGKTPPPELSFQIVPVGRTGSKLSPPNFAFEDGLYVLLKAATKAKKGQPTILPKAPEHLKHLVMKNFPPEVCKWSLSGPQFPQPTSFQQRYCYPHPLDRIAGDGGYSNYKGSSLWTVFDENGKEEEKFRILHVYYSEKRASNKGTNQKEISSPAGSPLRNPRVGSLGSDRVTKMRTPPKRSRRQSPSHRQNKQSRTLPLHPVILQSPAITASSASQHSLSSPFGSPLSFDMKLPPLPPPHPHDKRNRHHSQHTGYYHREMRHPPLVDQRQTRYPSQHRDSAVTPDSDLIHHPQAQEPRSAWGSSPFRRHAGSYPPTKRVTPVQQLAAPSLQHQCFPRSVQQKINTNAFENNSTSDHGEIYPCDMDTSLKDIDCSEWNDPWNDDPIFPLIGSKSSDLEQQELRVESEKNTSETDRLAARLEDVQESIREYILQAPAKEQKVMTVLFSSWAHQVSQDPLRDMSSSNVNKKIMSASGEGDGNEVPTMLREEKESRDDHNVENEDYRTDDEKRSGTKNDHEEEQSAMAEV